MISLLGLTACASNSEENAREPVEMELQFKASDSVNQDDQKRAAPIVVRLYELKTPETFNDADFFSLQGKDKAVLGDDMAARDQFQLRPGETKTIKRTANSRTTTLGVFAAYRDLPNSTWRATWPMPPSPPAAWYRFFSTKLKLVITLDANAIEIADGQSANK
jgi:type VI secretion system protein VasD